MKTYTDSPAAPSERIAVGIADFAVTTNGATLCTSGLGSCLGIVLYDPDAGVSAMGHAMLPTAAAADGDGDVAKFVDSLVALLVEKLVGVGADPGNLQAKVAGGSNMLNFSGEQSIGDRNVRQLRETLASFDVDVAAEEVGGRHGRSIAFDTDTTTLTIKTAKHGVKTV